MRDSLARETYRLCWLSRANESKIAFAASFLTWYKRGLMAYHDYAIVSVRLKEVVRSHAMLEVKKGRGFVLLVVQLATYGL